MGHLVSNELMELKKEVEKWQKKWKFEERSRRFARDEVMVLEKREEILCQSVKELLDLLDDVVGMKKEPEKKRKELIDKVNEMLVLLTE